jgi:hypothetical protein
MQSGAIDELVCRELADLGRNRDGVRTRRDTHNFLPKANFAASLFNQTSQYIANSAKIDDSRSLDAHG